ncbi:MAG: hypothetical protein FWB72_06570, partial [Firmicutes bacterium]|nr:hypothetical protein [Bacillota bacterium]
SSAKGVLDLDFNFVGFATPAQLDRLILIEGVSFNPQGREPSHFLGRNLKDYAQIAELRYARSVFSYFERVGRSALEIKQNIIRTINVDLTNNRIHMTAQTQVNIEIIGLTRLADKIRYLDAVYDDEVSRQAGEGNLPYLIIRVNLIANEVTVTTQIT